MKKNIDNTYGLLMSDFFYKELLFKKTNKKKIEIVKIQPPKIVSK